MIYFAIRAEMTKVCQVLYPRSYLRGHKTSLLFPIEHSGRESINHLPCVDIFSGDDIMRFWGFPQVYFCWLSSHLVTLLMVVLWTESLCESESGCFFLIEDTTQAEYGISGRAYFRKLVIMLIRIGYFLSIVDGNDHKWLSFDIIGPIIHYLCTTNAWN